VIGRGGGGGGGISINVNTMYLFGGSAAEIAAEFDKEIAALIEKNRSKITMALQSLFR